MPTRPVIGNQPNILRGRSIQPGTLGLPGGLIQPVIPKQPTDLSNTLQDAANQLTADRIATLTILNDVQAVNKSLLELEVDRITTELGKAHPRALLLSARLQLETEIAADIQSELQIAQIQTPVVGKNDTLVHGRVTDGSVGRSDFTVYLEDASRQPMGGPRPATNASGYYYLILDSSIVTSISKSSAYLAVTTNQNVLVYEDSEPLKVIKGVSLLVPDIVISKSDLSTAMGGKTVKRATKTK